MTAAYLLSRRYEVTLFEAQSTLGGHTATVDVEVNGDVYAIDTGFIVFNKKNYPNFCRLLDLLQVPIQTTEMSFSYRSQENSFEYNGHNLNTLFADRRNLFNPALYQMIKEIVRFNANAKKFLENIDPVLTMGEFIQKQAYKNSFLRFYLRPMIAAIWSMNANQINQIPAHFILQFYANHGLLDTSQQPRWYVIGGGSRQYIPYLVAPLKSRLKLNAKVKYITRSTKSITLFTENTREEFDAVVFATHADQALDMLSDATTDERSILSAFSYNANEVILHTDETVLPKNKRAWASWNYLDLGTQKVALTYYMNRLQMLKTTTHFCVSLNLTDHIAPEKILKKFMYTHPCYNTHTFLAQKKYAQINGKANTYFCGAYWGYGFHEDGVNSAMAVCHLLGVEG